MSDLNGITTELKKKTPTQLRRERKKRQKEREKRQKELERRGLSEGEVSGRSTSLQDTSSRTVSPLSNSTSENRTEESASPSPSQSSSHTPSDVDSKFDSGLPKSTVVQGERSAGEKRELVNARATKPMQETPINEPPLKHSHELKSSEAIRREERHLVVSKSEIPTIEWEVCNGDSHGSHADTNDSTYEFTIRSPPSFSNVHNRSSDNSTQVFYHPQSKKSHDTQSQSSTSFQSSPWRHSASSSTIFSGQYHRPQSPTTFLPSSNCHILEPGSCAQLTNGLVPKQNTDPCPSELLNRHEE